MKRTNVLRNTFISVGVFFALAQLVGADMNDGLAHISSTPSVPLSPPITTFDALGAGTGPYQGTLPFAINPVGTIAGYYFDPNPVTHGFVRHADGTFTTFDAPGGAQALTKYLHPGHQLCGAVTGNTRDSSDVGHGTCAPRTAPSSSSTLQARAQAPARAPLPTTSTRQG